jgi:hypothetical protein
MAWACRCETVRQAVLWQITARFKARDATFEGAQKYSDWKFVHALPAAPAATTKPGAKPTLK